MKITKSQLKQIIKEELETLNETSNTDPAKTLGDIYVRLEPNIQKLKPAMRKIRQTDPELYDVLDEIYRELRLYQQTTYKYKDLGEIR